MINWIKHKLSSHKNTSLSNPDELLTRLLLGNYNSSGITITPLQALGVGTVFACVSALSNTISTLPIGLYRKEGDSREPITDSNIIDVLANQPNEMMTSADFLTAVEHYRALQGNGFARIIRNQAGEPVELVPVENHLIQVETTEDRKVLYHINGDPQPLREYQMFHVKGLTRNGVVGLDTQDTVSEIIGLAIIVQDNLSRFFKNGSKPGSILEHPSKLSEPALERLKKQLEAKTSGENAYKTLILEEGLKYAAARISNVDSQLAQVKEQQDFDICRAFGVPPNRVGLKYDARVNSLEQQDTDYAKHTIRPICVRFEQQMNVKFLTRPQRRKGFYFKININGLMRGDVKTRGEFYSSMLDRGAMTINEVRSLEDMNPVEGGDVRLLPLNTALIEKNGNIVNPSNNEKSEVS